LTIDIKKLKDILSDQQEEADTDQSVPKVLKSLIKDQETEVIADKQGNPVKRLQPILIPAHIARIIKKKTEVRN
jgi:hypothetical protein